MSWYTKEEIEKLLEDEELRKRIAQFVTMSEIPAREEPVSRFVDAKAGVTPARLHIPLMISNFFHVFIGILILSLSLTDTALHWSLH